MLLGDVQEVTQQQMQDAGMHHADFGEPPDKELLALVAANNSNGQMVNKLTFIYVLYCTANEFKLHLNYS